MQGASVITFRWDNILAVALIVLGLVLIAVIPAQAFHLWKSSQGEGQ